MTPVHRDGFLGMTYRQWIALIALVNAFVATYLHLWKLGLAGALACGGSGGCAVVQFSQWSWFLGVDVALIGAVGYSAVVLVAVVGSTGVRVDARGPALVLAALVYPAILFTLRLKYAEFIVLKTFCPWCAISAVSITILGVIVAFELRRTRAVATSAVRTS
ncbi:MAG: vitamin K epoxide reductase family protein [Gemmatimonadota bacterium]|nr:vitamin K epoxide reductase family protein [Gemmatimonadota bacterium]